MDNQPRKTPQLSREVQYKHHTQVRGPMRKAIYTVRVNGIIIGSFESTVKTPVKAMNASKKMLTALTAALAPCDVYDNVQPYAVKTRMREHWVKRRFTRTRTPISELPPLEDEDQ